MVNHVKSRVLLLKSCKTWWNHGEISISNSSITIFVVAPGAPRMAHGWPACHTRWAPRRRAAPRPRRWRRGATLARWAQPSRQPRHCAPWRMMDIDTSSTAQGGGGSFKNRKPIGEVGCCESGMAERIHWWTERCLRSPLFRSLSLTIYLRTYLSSMYLSIDLSLSLSFICLSV